MLVTFAGVTPLTGCQVVSGGTAKWFSGDFNGTWTFNFSGYNSYLGACGWSAAITPIDVRGYTDFGCTADETPATNDGASLFIYSSGFWRIQRWVSAGIASPLVFNGTASHVNHCADTVVISNTGSPAPNIATGGTATVSPV